MRLSDGVGEGTFLMCQYFLSFFFFFTPLFPSVAIVGCKGEGGFGVNKARSEATDQQK